MARVVTLGEALLRLAPPGHARLSEASSFDVHYGGSEMNVAIALSQWGVDVSAVTKVPQNFLGDAFVSHLRRFGVRTDSVIRGGSRLGVYYYEHGMGVRPGRVVYDRQFSAMATIDPDELEPESVLRGCDVLHLSGITLGISPAGFEVARRFMGAAQQLGVTVSFDINYRKALWSLDEAREKISRVMPAVDILYASVPDMIHILGVSAGQDEDYAGLCREVMQRYPVSQVVTSHRTILSSSQHEYRASMFDGERSWDSKRYQVDILDRVGAGDALAAGFLYGQLTGRGAAYRIEFAAAAAAMAHTVSGDALVGHAVEIEDIMTGSGANLSR